MKIIISIIINIITCEVCNGEERDSEEVRLEWTEARTIENGRAQTGNKWIKGEDGDDEYQLLKGSREWRIHYDGGADAHLMNR